MITLTQERRIRKIEEKEYYVELKELRNARIEDTIKFNIKYDRCFK